MQTAYIFLILLVPALSFQLATDNTPNHRYIDAVLNERYGGVVFYGSADSLGFSLADGGSQGENRTVVIGARQAKKTFVINYQQSDLPAAYNLDLLDPNKSLVITAQDNGEILPHCIYILKNSPGWIPSMLLGGWLVGKGTAYTIRGESMIPGVFSVYSINNQNGHRFTGGYSAIQNDRCGSSGATGDLNGDGYPDIAIGCRDGSYVAVVYGGPEAGQFPAGFDLATITNTTGVIITSGCNCGLGGGYLGYSVTFGYFNNDDIQDIAVTASWAYSSNPFKVHVIFGKAGGYADKFINVNNISAGSGYTIISDRTNHDLTQVTAGKFSHEEGSAYTDDLIIGDSATLAGEQFFGRVIVIFGTIGGFNGTTIRVSDLTQQTGMIIWGESSGRGGLGINVQLIKTRAGKRRTLVVNEPYYQTQTRKKAGRLLQIFPFDSYKLSYNVSELNCKITVGNEGDSLGSNQPGATSITAVKNSNGLQDIFIGSPDNKKAYLLFSS